MSANAPAVRGHLAGLPGPKGLSMLYLPVLALLFVCVVAARAENIPVASITRDMAALDHEHPLFGVVSNVGILLCFASAAICLFCRGGGGRGGGGGGGGGRRGAGGRAGV